MGKPYADFEEWLYKLEASANQLSTAEIKRFANLDDLRVLEVETIPEEIKTP